MSNTPRKPGGRTVADGILHAVDQGIRANDARRYNEVRVLSDYRLPGGRIVAIYEDVARGRRLIDFQLEGGAIVVAERVGPPSPDRLEAGVRALLANHTEMAKAVNFTRCGCETCKALRAALGEES